MTNKLRPGFVSAAVLEDYYKGECVPVLKIISRKNARLAFLNKQENGTISKEEKYLAEEVEAMIGIVAAGEALKEIYMGIVEELSSKNERLKKHLEQTDEIMKQAMSGEELYLQLLAKSLER